MNPFQVPATLVGGSFLKDRSMSVRFNTQELNTDEKLIVSEYMGTYGYLLFAPEPFAEAPKEVPEKKGQSMSQMLRRKAFELFKARTRQEEFEEWYKMLMNSIMATLDRKIELAVETAEQTNSTLPTGSTPSELKKTNTVPFVAHHTCPECDSHVEKGVCQNAGCKERLL